MADDMKLPGNYARFARCDDKIYDMFEGANGRYNRLVIPGICT